MKKKMMLAIVVMLLTGSLFMSDTTFAAWTQAKGHSYHQLSLSYYVTDEIFTTVRSTFDVVKEIDTINGIGGTERENQDKFESYTISYYGEYGITDILTIFASVPWKRVTSMDDKDVPTGIGDIDLGLRYNLTKNLFGSGLLMSVQGTVKIPEAYSYGYYKTNQNLGTGQYDTTLAVLLGKGFSKGYAWLNVGYMYRFENNEFDPLIFRPSDQVKILIGGGYPILPPLSLRGFVNWTTSVGNASVSRELIGSSFLKVDKGYLEEHVLIKSELALEPNFLNIWVDLALDLNPKKQIVLSYSRDVAGKDYSLGETFILAFVYKY